LFKAICCHRYVFVWNGGGPSRAAEIEYLFLTNIVWDEGRECLVGSIPSSEHEIDGWIDLTILIRISAVMIAGIHFACCSDLFGVGHILGLFAAFLHGAEHRERDAGQNSDNRNHDQQFNQRKSADALTLLREHKY
jgi:hypothetical protein